MGRAARETVERASWETVLEDPQGNQCGKSHKETVWDELGPLADQCKGRDII